MAVVDISHVEKQLKAIMKGSNIVKNLVRKALEQVEHDPAAYGTLTPPPDFPELVGRSDVFVRKVPIVHQSHDYRMVYLHLVRDPEDSVVFLYVRPREDDYRSLDWDQIRSFIVGE
jgi:hypothetical protein